MDFTAAAKGNAQMPSILLLVFMCFAELNCRELSSSLSIVLIQPLSCIYSWQEGSAEFIYP
jgi:hypothetical protein